MTELYVDGGRGTVTHALAWCEPYGWIRETTEGDWQFFGANGNYRMRGRCRDYEVAKTILYARGVPLNKIKDKTAKWEDK